MKLKTTEIEFNQLPLLNQLFWALWLDKKGYKPEKELELGKVLELSFALTSDLRFDSPAERTTFNNSLQYEETLYAFDGSEPIETLWYEVNEKLKRRIISYLAVKK